MVIECVDEMDQECCRYLDAYNNQSRWWKEGAFLAWRVNLPSICDPVISAIALLIWGVHLFPFYLLLNSLYLQDPPLCIYRESHRFHDSLLASQVTLRMPTILLNRVSICCILSSKYSIVSPYSYSATAISPTCLAVLLVCRRLTASMMASASDL